MNDKIFTVTIAFLTALVTALIAPYIKGWQDQKINDRNAMRDYEYEAKKRLYQSYEPLFFLFAELSEIALRRIKGIAKSLNEESYKDEWKSLSNYYFRETIYKIFAPIATIKLIKEKLTSVDLGIDKNLNCQYGLLKILYFSFQEDYKIARILKDEEYNKKWLDHYRTDNTDVERQGLNLTELDKFLKLLIKDNNGIYSLIEIGDYEDLVSNNEDVKKQRSIKIVEKVFQDFDFKKKRILWILLLSHACIYYILTETKTNSKLSKETIDKHINDFFIYKTVDYRASNDESENKICYESARVYIKKQISKQLKFD